MKNISVISRKSPLAIIQVEEVRLQLEKALGTEVLFNVATVSSIGDKDKKSSLMSKDIPADFFTRELDDAIITGNADIAIHSAKDLPYPLHSELEIAALTIAANQSDSLVSKNNLKLEQLPYGARIGTSSEARKNQLLKIRPDFQIISIRGTIEERIQQVKNGHIDALIVATCALNRLGLNHLIAEELPFATHPLQGHLAVVIKKGNHELKTLFSSIDTQKKRGHVSIAGFGPGNPELATQKCLNALKQADAIFYDDLLDDSFLENYKAEKVYVGKRKGKHSFSQDDINEQLYKAAVTGKKVVRLKGGDPLIFGRGSEEYHYLASRLITAEIIPGISSALAAAADAIIPLTARGLSSSVAFLSGHDLVKLKIPQTDTLVFYMGASNQQALALKLQSEGWSASTPVAVIQNASLPNVRTEYYSINSLVNTKETLESPCIMIVGNTASRDNQLLPKRWLYTGTSVNDFNEQGIAVHTPLIEINKLELTDEIINTLEDIHSYNRIIFTSRHGVKAFFNCLFELGKDARYLQNIEITPIGKTTAASLKQYGILANPPAVNDDSDALVNWFKDNHIHSEKILIPRSAIGLPVIPKGLRALGNVVNDLSVYTTRLPKSYIRQNLEDFYGVIFTSPSTVSNFLEVYGSIPSHLKIKTRGSQTALRLKQILNKKTVQA